MINDFNIIVAMDSKRGIGKERTMPWHLPEDLMHFKEITCGEYEKNIKNVVIMGRKTWDSVPDKYRPFKDRINIILSRNKDLSLPEGVFIADSFYSIGVLVKELSLSNSIGDIFVIGGQQIFEQAISLPQCKKLFVTHIENDFNCDKFFPDFKTDFREISVSAIQRNNDISYNFAQYVRG